MYVCIYVCTHTLGRIENIYLNNIILSEALLSMSKVNEINMHLFGRRSEVSVILRKYHLITVINCLFLVSSFAITTTTARLFSSNCCFPSITDVVVSYQTDLIQLEQLHRQNFVCATGNTASR